MSYPRVPEKGEQTKLNRLHANAINGLLQGHINTTGRVTLTTGTAATAVSLAGIAENAVVVFSPTTANAANELATLYVTIGTNQFTIHHASNTQNDRTFGYAVFGAE